MVRRKQTITNRHTTMTTNKTLRADNDMFHHLNNPIYGVLIDSIINSYLIQHCGYSTSLSTHIGLVANSYCDYFGSAHYPGMLNVGLRVVKIGNSSVLYEVAVFQEGEEQVKAVGGFTQIWVERASNKVTKEGVPGSIREPLKPLLVGSEQEARLGGEAKL
jgi:acyl-CoA thioester hydrolase